MKSVLVVVTRQIGDVLLTTPLIHLAKQTWPEAAVDVLGFEGTLGMLAGNPDVRSRIEVPARGGVLALARRLWRRYDLALIADPGDRAHLIGFVAARERSGLLPSTSSSNWWKRLLLSHAVTSEGDLSSQHVVAEKLGLLVGWRSPQGTPPALVAPSSSPHNLQLRARYIVIHTPSMWPYKQWPLAHFRDLIARLSSEGHQVVLTGGPADRATVASMLDAGEGVVDAGVLSFNQLAALIRGAALYIGPDTSVSHLAAACDVPVLTIFGPTNPQRWSPWAGSSFERRGPVQTIGKITLIQSELHCVPCGKAGCEDHRQSRSDCLQDISPALVAGKALELLRSE